MSVEISSALQRRLLDGLLEIHPLPWRIGKPSQDWICEVVDAKRHLVLKCANETEAVELIEAAMALSTVNARNDLEVDRGLQQKDIMTTKPRNARDLFDKLLPLALAKHSDKARAIAETYCFQVSSSSGEGGEWTVDCVSNPPICVRGDTGKATCTIAVADNDMMTIIKDRDAAMKLYFQGRLVVVSGDPMIAMKLQALFAIAIPE